MRKHIFYIFVFLLMIINISEAQRGMRRIGKYNVLPKVSYRTSWALLIGINIYSNLPVQYQLDYAVDDVKALKEVLVEQYQFPESNITILTNEQATRQGITRAMGRLTDSSKIKFDDRVLIYFSGHGQTVPLPSPHDGEMGFILPCDAEVDMSDVANPSAYFSTCLAMSMLRELANLIPAKHVLFLIDACYSGLAIRGKGGLQPSVPGYLHKVASVHVRQVITAGMKGEQSYEKPEWGHGAFTYKILEALRTGVADGNNDGVITGLELASYLRNVVPNIADQTPQYGYFGGEGEFLFLGGTVHKMSDSEHMSYDKMMPEIPQRDMMGFIEMEGAGIGRTRPMARRAAEVTAHRSFVEFLHGVRIDSETIVADAEAVRDEITSKAQGSVRYAEMAGTSYERTDDSKWEATVKMRLPIQRLEIEKSVREYLFQKISEEPSIRPKMTQGELSDLRPDVIRITEKGPYTGLIVDARTLDVRMAIIPRILTPSGLQIYGLKSTPNYTETDHGLVYYVRDLDEAKALKWLVGDRPLIIKAIAVKGKNRSDVVVDDAYAAAILASNKRDQFLKLSKVVFITD